MCDDETEINSRTDPEHFSNIAIVDIEILEDFSVLLGGMLDSPEKQLINLAVLAESIVLNNKLVVTGSSNKWAFDRHDHHSTETDELIDLFARNGAVDIDEKEGPRSIISKEVEGKVFDTHEWSVDGPTPWDTVADIHGIPYCSDAYYSIGALGKDYPINVSKDLYLKLELFHKEIFKEIKRYLGKTHIRIPSILGMVFKGCKSVDDIPINILNVREQLEKYRKKCTELEYELRTASTIHDQIKIVVEIQNAYQIIEEKFKNEQQKTRVIYRTFDIVKSVNPLKIGANLVDIAKKYDIEKAALLRVPGYYDLWKATLEVEQGYSSIERLFGNRMAKRMMNGISQQFEN